MKQVIDDALAQKMQKTLEVICTLYKNDTIESAHIVGSFAKSIIEGTPVKETSDIDIIVINPLFENPSCDLIPEDITDPVQGRVIRTLKDIGATFRDITLPLHKQADVEEEDYLHFSFVIYKNEIFHIMPLWHVEEVIYPSLHIDIDDCKHIV